MQLRLVTQFVHKPTTNVEHSLQISWTSLELQMTLNEMQPQRCWIQSMILAVMKAVPQRTWQKVRTTDLTAWDLATWPWWIYRASWPHNSKDAVGMEPQPQIALGLEQLFWWPGLCCWLGTHGTWCDEAWTSNTVHHHCCLTPCPIS